MMLGAWCQTKRKKKEGERKHRTERLLSGLDPSVGEEDQMQLPPWLHVVKPAVPGGRRDGEQPGSLRRAQIIKSSDCRAGHIKKLIGLHVAPCCGHPWAKSCLDASRQLRQIVWLKIRLEHCQCPCLEAPLKNEGTCVWEPRLGRELLMNNVPAFVARTHSSFQLLEKTKPLKPEFTTFHWSSIWLELQDASPQAKFVSVKICFLLKKLFKMWNLKSSKNSRQYVQLQNWLALNQVYHKQKAELTIFILTALGWLKFGARINNFFPHSLQENTWHGLGVLSNVLTPFLAISCLH